MAGSTARITPSLSVRDATPAAMRAFFRIADLWQLRNAEARTLLGEPPESTFYKWKAGDTGSVSRDVLERVSYILGIFRSLQTLLPEPSMADTWLRRPNSAPLFGGRSALDQLLSGNVSDLFRVREYLDGEQGGWS